MAGFHARLVLACPSALKSGTVILQRAFRDTTRPDAEAKINDAKNG
jgi:hypothetical protein